MKCCNKEVQIIRTIHLLDISNKSDRTLYVGRCNNPKCEALVAELVWYDHLKGHYDRYKPKKKDVSEYIKKLEKEPYLENIIMQLKHGTKSNMSWKYHLKGCIYDFNGTLISSAYIKQETILKDLTV